jgi:hypothetical protein
MVGMAVMAVHVDYQLKEPFPLCLGPVSLVDSTVVSRG